MTKYVEIRESEVPSGVRFDVPAYNQGQIVEVAYGGFSRGEHGSGDPYKRVTDRGVGGYVKYYRRCADAVAAAASSSTTITSKATYRISHGSEQFATIKAAAEHMIATQPQHARGEIERLDGQDLSEAEVEQVRAEREMAQDLADAGELETDY